MSPKRGHLRKVTVTVCLFVSFPQKDFTVWYKTVLYYQQFDIIRISSVEICFVIFLPPS